MIALTPEGHRMKPGLNLCIWSNRRGASLKLYMPKRRRFYCVGVNLQYGGWPAFYYDSERW